MADGGLSKGEELLREVVGDYKFSERDMGWIARRIIDINKLYLSLDITSAERRTLLENNLRDHDNMKTDMMILWRSKKGNQATLRTLVVTLVDDDLADDSGVQLAEEIIKKFKSRCNDGIAIHCPIDAVGDFDQPQSSNVARLENQAGYEDQRQVEELAQAGNENLAGNEDQEENEGQADDQDQEHQSTTMDIIWQLSPEMTRYINMMSLIPYLNKYGILTSDQRHHLNSPYKAPGEKVTYLLGFLESKGEETIQKFLLALKEAKEHTGHIELCRLLNEKGVNI